MSGVRKISLMHQNHHRRGGWVQGILLLWHVENVTKYENELSITFVKCQVSRKTLWCPHHCKNMRGNITLAAPVLCTWDTGANAKTTSLSPAKQSRASVLCMYTYSYIWFYVKHERRRMYFWLHLIVLRNWIRFLIQYVGFIFFNKSYKCIGSNFWFGFASGCEAQWNKIQ